MRHFAKHQIWELWWGYCAPKVRHAQPKSSSNRETTPPSSNKSLTHTHTLTKTNNTYSPWLESRDREGRKKKKRKRKRERVPSLESVTPRTDTQRQSWSSKMKSAAPRGLKRPILPILVSWSTPRSTVMLLNAANPCPHWLLDAPTPTLQLLLPQNSTSLLPPRLDARGARSSIQPKKITIHTRNTKSVANKTRQESRATDVLLLGTDSRFALNNALLLHPPAQIPAILAPT
jgi:hypothetical protein